LPIGGSFHRRCVVRVDLYNPTVASEATAQANKVSNDKTVSGQTKQAAAQKPSTEDTTTLTSASDSVQNLTKTALQTTPSREAKVASLKLAVNNATYQLDAAKIAESLAGSDV
jgi:flagellar biosynthesis anti-sigma factor FlgM